MNIEKITQGKNLTDTERTVLEYILDHLDTVQTEGVRGVARANYTSTSTIMRLARKMNYSGFVDMCYKLRSFTETPHQTMQEEEDFLNGFSTQSLLNYNTYTQLKVCAEKLLEQRDKMTFIYGTRIFRHGGHLPDPEAGEHGHPVLQCHRRRLGGHF